MLGMRTPPPPDPYDYAAPDAPNNTHLWDMQGVAKVLGLSARTRWIENNLPKNDIVTSATRGGTTHFYTLDAILEWDKQQPQRRLDDHGRQRKVIDDDGHTWIDGEQVHTTKEAADILGLKYGTFRRTALRGRSTGNTLFEPAHRLRNRDVYWSPEQIDAIRGGGTSDAA